jgi:hypothetical protein
VGGVYICTCTMRTLYPTLRLFGGSYELKKMKMDETPKAFPKMWILKSQMSMRASIANPPASRPE